MAGMDYDVARVRACFPALADGTAYFDGPGGSQVPRQVADAVAATMTSGISNRGTVTASERRAEEVVVGARAAMADLLGCDPGGVVFGRSMTQLTFDLARALAKTWEPGDEVVVTRLDHDANVRPWKRVADALGIAVRWVDFDTETAELQFDPSVLSDRTRLVAVTGASNLLGTRPDLAGIAAHVHEAGALLYVDGVHLTPHAPVSVRDLGADFYACSPYKFFGPHLGVLAADPALLELVHPDKLLPSTDQVPERFELGTLPYELLAGVTATVDFIADLAPGQAVERRSRVLESLQRVETYEEVLFERLLSGLDAIDGVRRYGRPARRTPTVLFSMEGRAGREVHESLAAAGVNAPASSFYAIETSRWIGLGDTGAVRAGLAPYTSEEDVDRLLAGVADLARAPR
jgi:cysteine desulfurase family protein (TIGR01976 family)